MDLLQKRVLWRAAGFMATHLPTLSHNVLAVGYTGQDAGIEHGLDVPGRVASAP